ncbi:MAG: hypothetical protein RL754_664 [Bacteroidota bacterium]|jgi:CubicO group peptidase (beta-lactamase class C family)
MKKLTRVLAVLIVLFLGLKFSPYGYIIKGIAGAYLDGHSSAHIYDREHFDQRDIPVINAQTLPEATFERTLDPDIAATLEDFDTKGLIVIENDSITYENYWDEHGPSTISNSFSTAKTVITLLVQIAIQDGYIGSWDDLITDYIPEYTIPAGTATPTLRHLSTMTAGLKAKENYKNPLNRTTAKLYYGDDVVDLALTIPPGKNPTGEVYEYQSIQTQLLTIALSRAVGESIASYANRELFAKVGFESQATWHLDSDGGLELGFCCLNASVRDFAKLGQLVLHHGYKGEHAIVDSTFLAMATTGYKSPYYGHSFWIYPAPYDYIFGFRGMLGQDIIIDPRHNRTVVRVGQHRGKKTIGDFNEMEAALLRQTDLWDAQ